MISKRRLPSPSKPATRTVSGATKRGRSPDPHTEPSTSQNVSKRIRAAGPSQPAHTDDRDQKRVERETEFRVKYTRAFPAWKFYFDVDTLDPSVAVQKDALESKVNQLGGQIEDFFSNEITHLITNQPVPGDNIPGNKENSRRSQSSQLKSPTKIRTRPLVDDAAVVYDHLVLKAVAFNMKIWNVSKLESVLDRCLAVAPSPFTTRPNPAAVPNPKQRSLTRLLQSERIHGTSERDPSQKRHDFRYFSRNSFFVLVEDLQQELATIAAVEYPAVKARDNYVKPEWPVLYCHPHSRGPFIPFDEKEKKRWEKTQRQEVQKDDEEEQTRLRKIQQEQIRRKAEAKSHQKHDLRRSASMHNLQQRRASHPHSVFTTFVDLDADGDTLESATASGYLASGTGSYMAASGNSVGITSNTGTTSTSGKPMRGTHLTSALHKQIEQQVVTSRKAAIPDKGIKPTVMGPPPALPERMLKKSRSTNTLRLPKRKETTKPGYCESCRSKFDDFKSHVTSRRHRKFAHDESNFLQLDYVLGRVQRKTQAEVAEESLRRQHWSVDDEFSDQPSPGSETQYIDLDE